MDRVENFEQKRFGMFIHFGLFSELEKGEWVWYTDEKARKNYAELYEKFNPVNLDWKEIVGTAKKAGMKYITLTTRHHDGFSLYDTKGLSDYDVTSTPYKKDIVKEFVDECNRQGITPFLYHTMHDWQKPLFKEDFNAYLTYLQKSVEILCTQYGKIGGLWFDGNWSNRSADWQEDELYGLIRKYQPDAIIINNSGLSRRGQRGNPQLDTVTFEQGNIQKTEEAGLRHLASEASQTMNHHWGSATMDIDYKSPRNLIEMLCKCRKCRANYLLNIGLRSDGTIPQMSKALLDTLAIWTNYAADTFYDGVLSDVEGEPKDFGLAKNGKLYLYVHDLPMVNVNNVVETYGDTKEGYILKNVKGKVRRVYWKDNEEDLLFTQNGEELAFRAVGFPYGSDLIVRIAVIEFA